MEEKKDICPCKGIRICRICEDMKNRLKKNYSIIIIDDIIKIENKEDNINNIFVNKDEFISKLMNFSLINQINGYSDEKLVSIINDYFKNERIFNDFFKKDNFLNFNEENNIIKECNEFKWIESQSGRKKQDFGPKINYKRKKVNFSKIQFPKYIFILEEKIKGIKFLNNFKIRELGNLLYSANQGAHIEPHVDHSWIWGDRILGVNLISSTIMTFSIELKILNLDFLFELNIPINVNSLYLMSGSSRYNWKHGVKSENIKTDRIVLTLREFDEKFYQDNKHILNQYYDEK